VPTRAAAAALLKQGSALVQLADGPRAARALLPGRKIAVDVPEVKVVDTIGAGDAFGGAFLAWWIDNGLGRADLHARRGRAAVAGGGERTTGVGLPGQGAATLGPASSA
jgi:fructokinase